MMTNGRGRPSASEHDAAIGDRIRCARLARGLTMEALAQVLGVSWQQVSKYEKGQNRVAGSRLPLLASTLGVTAGDLLGDIGQSAPVLGFYSPESLRLAAAIDRLGPAERAAITTLVERLPLPAAAEPERDAA